MLTNAELANFLTSIVALLLAAHLMGFAFERMRLPRVVGEITGGFVLGPSCLGYFAPEITEFLIPGDPFQDRLLNAFHWVGLTLLMFTAGFRVQHGVFQHDKRVMLVLLASVTVLPFLAGWAITVFVDMSTYNGPNGNALTLALIVGIAVAVTSIPVISRIFIDLDIIQTRFARIVIGVATIQDILLWAVLAIATSLAGVEVASKTDLSLAVAKPFLFCAVGIVVGPILLTFVQRLRITTVVRSAKLGFALIWCFLVAQFAALLDVNVIFGAFVAGIVLGSLKPGQMENEKNQIANFSLAFFIPLYFAIVGYAIDLPNAFDPWLFFGFLIFSTVVEGLCAFGAIRAMRFNNLTSLNFAVAMNTRGGPGIVLASIALASGLVDQRMYVALVLTAIVTSVVAGAWFRYRTLRERPLMEDRQVE
ncbi:MAG: sodium:proton exchanger [Rhodospirillaceae bacterium]|nr:sodium:proton exchanger [Rhodospirillaceae bacterium]